MAIRAALKFVFFAGLFCWAAAVPITASAAGADKLRAEIDAFIERTRLSSNDVVRWEGAESVDVRDDGADAVAEIVKGRISIQPANAKPAAMPMAMTFDRIEIRRSPDGGGGDRIRFTAKLPTLSRLVVPDGSDVTLALKDASLTALVEGAAQHQRSAALNFAGGRIEHQASASWLTFGPLTSQWQLVDGDKGSWTAPADFELKSIEFAVPQASLTGAVERIGYAGGAAGPNIVEMEALRDQFAELREQSDPNKKVAEILSLVPKILTEFANAKGELAIERVSAKKTDGTALVFLSKAALGGSIAGLDGDKLTLRFTLGHDGLTIDPSLFPTNQVPRHTTIDFGIEGISVATLRNLAEAAGHMGPDASDADKQQALPQIIAAAMSLTPVFRLYTAAVEFPDVKIDATGEATRGSPVPFGYIATGDITVHGFDALPQVLTDKKDRQHLALLKFIGEPATDADGAKVMKFHLASQTGKPITVNGSDISGWFNPNPGTLQPGQPRVLRLTDPPLTGDDVRAVQKVVMEDGRTDGIYDGPTALAVARFQRLKGLNVSGVVDPPTATKLGLKPPEKPPAAPKN